MKASDRRQYFSIGWSTNGNIAVVAWLAVLLVPGSLLRAATSEPVAFAQSAPATGVFDFIEVGHATWAGDGKLPGNSNRPV